MPTKPAKKKKKPAATKKPAAKRKPAAKSAPVVDAADPRFVPVAATFAKTPGFSLMESKSRGTRGLMLRGKSFGMSTDGRFVLKITAERVAELVGAGVGKPFEASAGRVLKDWIEITSANADWVALAREAHAVAARK